MVQVSNGYTKEELEKRKKKEALWKSRKYICKSKIVDIHTGSNIVVLNKDEAEENEIYPGYRVIIKYGNKKTIAIVDTSDTFIKKGEIGIYRDVSDFLNIREGAKIQIQHTERPPSLDYIRRKLDGFELTQKQISTIVSDLMSNRLSQADLGVWISSMYIRGMSDSEVVALTNAITNSGSTLDLKVSPIADKHCIGGVAGNRTTMLVVPIVASAGVYIPKTSSRAITSAAGTADTMEVLADVDISLEEMRRLVLKTKGAIVWGGGMNLASADDKMVQIRRPLSLDPKGVLLASILAKKKSVGSKHVVIDIPIGRGAKLDSMEEANSLGMSFLKIGKRLGMNMEVLVTDGSEPIGRGVGPALEARDVLSILSGKDGPEDLKSKSCIIAGKILELTGKAKPSKGYDMAMKILESGKAYKKLSQIVEYQGGDPRMRIKDLPIGTHTYKVRAKQKGRISHLDNKKLSKIARAAGSPRDKGAGIYIHKVKGDYVKKGDVLFEIYAENESKLDFAIKSLDVWYPVEMEKVLLTTLG